MDSKTLAALLLKITGLVLIVVSVSQVPGYIPLAQRGYNYSIWEVLGTTLVAFGPLTAIGVVLWLFPGTVANKIVSSAPSGSPAADTHAIEIAALTVLGVYLMCHAVIGLTRDITFLIVETRRSDALSVTPVSVITHLVSTGVEFLIGFGLCIGSRGVSRVIEKLRR
jgi:hypothetical protein